MSVSILKNLGLVTDPNPYDVQPGALTQADNAVIDKPGIVTARRGFEDSGMTAVADPIKSVAFFEEKQLLHHGSTLSVLDGTARTALQGAYTAAANEKMRFALANQNTYFTTSEGVYRLEEASTDPMPAGAVPCPIKTDPSVTGTSGFLTANSQVAYRYVWGFKDEHGRIIYGPPSQRMVVSGFSNPVVTTAAGLTRAGSTVTITTAAAHGYSVGHVVYLNSTDPNFPSGNKTIATTPTGTTFTYSEAGSASTSTVAQTFYYASKNVSHSLPLPGKSYQSSAGGTARSGSTVTSTVNFPMFSVPMKAGETYWWYLCASGDPNFPDGWKFITVVSVGISSAVITYTESGTAATSAATLTFSEFIDLRFFIQVYRTNLSVSGTSDPGDEMGLVFEASPTFAQIISRAISFTDNTPVDFGRGQLLYTNPSQGGISRSNIGPPRAEGLCVHNGMLFYGRAKSSPYMLLRLLTTSVVSNDDINFIIFDSRFLSSTTYLNYSRQYYGDSFEGTVSGNFRVYTSGSAAQNIENTAKSLIRRINNTQSVFYGEYVSGPDDPPGMVMVRFYYPTSNEYFSSTFHRAGGTLPPWAPALSRYVDSISYTRTSNVRTVNLSTSFDTTDLSVGQSLYEYDLANSGAVIERTIKSIPSSTSFTYDDPGPNGGASFQARFFTHDPSAADLAIKIERDDNVLAVSEVDDPDTVPLSNYFKIGRADKKILRLASLKNSLYVFKEDGLWRVTGDSPDTLDIRSFDSTFRLVAPSSVAMVGNALYALTNRGVAQITDFGVRYISQAIDSTLLDIYTAAPDQVREHSFGVGYESYKKYILWTVSSSSDTNATQAFVYDLAAGYWTKWTKPAHCAAVSPDDDKIYLSRGTQLSKERKDATAYKNQADEGFSVTVSSSSAGSVTFSSGTGINVGDLLYYDANTQYHITEQVNANTFLVDTTSTPATGAATILPAIPFAMTWAPFTAGNPATEKSFSRVNAIVHGARASGATIGFATDVAPTPVEVDVTPIGGTAFSSGPLPMVGVPLEAQRGAALTVSLEHQKAWEIPAIAGLVIDAETTGEHGNR